jgi:heme oxygenase (biliverdin-IX-beta and delta-forming)
VTILSEQSAPKGPPVSESPVADPRTGHCTFHAQTTAEVASLAQTLRECTQEQHTRAERHPFQARMVKGEVTRQDYAAYLAQMRPVIAALDAGLRRNQESSAALRGMVAEHHFHTALIDSDLRFLGWSSGDGTLLPATERFLALVERAADQGPALIGVWYVIEGSTNGGRFIAKALARALALENGDGTRWFDPHGSQQRERWQGWRAALDAQQFSAEERRAIVEAAAATFDAVYDLLDGLPQRDAVASG